jgi:hypothetical protein
MARIGKISPIRKKYPAGELTVEATLANTYGKNRMPGAGITKLPYKRGDGTYSTGLEDKPEERKRLEEALRLDLSPGSVYYNYLSPGAMKVKPIKLRDEDNIFNLEDAEQAVTYYWLSVHPTIASSWDAWDAGKYPSDTAFYVNNTDIETERQYRRDIQESHAIIRLGALSVEKTRKVARLLGFPVSDDNKHEHVYPLIYGFIKQGVAKTGPYANMNTVDQFNKVASMTDEDLHVTDLVERAINNNLIRISAGGRLMKGATELAKSKEEYIEFIGSIKGQDDLLLLEQDLNVKESIAK